MNPSTLRGEAKKLQHTELKFNVSSSGPRLLGCQCKGTLHRSFNLLILMADEGGARSLFNIHWLRNNIAGAAPATTRNYVMQRFPTTNFIYFIIRDFSEL